MSDDKTLRNIRLDIRVDRETDERVRKVADRIGVKRGVAARMALRRGLPGLEERAKAFDV